MSLLAEIQSFLTHHTDLGRGDRLLIAFSGGPDSLALAWALRKLQPTLGLDLHALHVDHGLDGDSERRAAAALGLCQEMKIRCTVERHPIAPADSPSESLEAAARRVRYRVLEDCRRKLDARYVATGHHADDQIETLLIRLLYGTGIEGLAGIRARKGRIIRPLLHLSRARVRAALATSGLVPIADPTNHHLGIVRNRIRQLVWPKLSHQKPGLRQKVQALADSATGARKSIERVLQDRLQLSESPSGIAFSREDLVQLPSALWPYALAWVHRKAGAPYPPTGASRQELARQVDLGGRIGCDCGNGWRWESREDLIALVQHPAPTTPSFAYTVEAPGECEISELALRFSIRRGPVDRWMFRQSSRRVGLVLPIEPGEPVVVRNRRPGDRVRPLGCRYMRRLKDLLIDRRVPRNERDRLPLLEVASSLAWVPGVTVNDTCRVEPGQDVWIAELESI